jgi:UDP-N-acetylmuramyl tripeptide synthase
VHEVPHPSEAVRVALAAAGPEGAVLWAGTGRTEYRDVAGEKLPYSFWNEAHAAVSEWASAVEAVRTASGSAVPAVAG